MTTSECKPERNLKLSISRETVIQQAFSTVFQHRINKTALGQPSVNKNKQMSVTKYYNETKIRRHNFI